MIKLQYSGLVRTAVGELLRACGSHAPAGLQGHDFKFVVVIMGNSIYCFGEAQSNYRFVDLHVDYKDFSPMEFSVCVTIRGTSIDAPFEPDCALVAAWIMTGLCHDVPGEKLMQSMISQGIAKKTVRIVRDYVTGGYSFYTHGTQPGDESGGNQVKITFEEAVRLLSGMH